MKLIVVTIILDKLDIMFPFMRALYTCDKLMTDLGILIDDQLSFSPHIDTVCTKAKHRAVLLLNCLYSLNTCLLIRDFIAYVRSLLEYFCSVLSPSKLGVVDKLESIQRSFTKRLHGQWHLSYSERLKL